MNNFVKEIFMGRRNRTKSQKEVIYHQQNPPPKGPATSERFSACGKIIDPKDKLHELIVDRNEVNCLNCLSRPDPNAVDGR